MDKILVIQTAFVGDAVLTLPMIQKLHEKSPGFLIDVIAIPSTAEIFKASPIVNDVIILDKKNEHKSFLSLRRFIKDLKKKNYKKIISPHRSFRTSLIVLGLDIRETTGFSNASLPHVYKNLIDYNYDDHEVKRNLSLIDFEGDWKIFPEVSADIHQLSNVSKILGDINNLSEFCAVAPGSIWNTKKYPLEYFTEIIKFFVDRGETVLLFGSEKDAELCLKLSKEFNQKVFSMAGKLSIVESIEVLKKAKILISNDSAPTHFGMCARIPVLTLFCSTIPRFGFYPYNSKSRYLSYDDLFCKPCGIHGHDKCPINTFECGYKLTPAKVTAEIKEMLDEQARISL